MKQSEILYKIGQCYLKSAIDLISQKAFDKASDFNRKAS